MAQGALSATRWRKPSARQLEVLRIVAQGPTSWGEIWAHYNGVGAQDFRNFERVTDALLRRGYVRHNVAGDVEITDAGRHVICTCNDDLPFHAVGCPSVKP